MIRVLKMMGGALLAAALVACGGGGGSSGTTSGPTPSRVADFTLSTDKSQVASTGAETAMLTVVALDASRNIVASAPVTVSVNNGGVFTPVGTSTDATGTYTGTVSIGTDKTERDLTLTVTVNGIVKTATVRVVARETDFALFLDKTSIKNNGSDNATLTVLALDANRNAVASVPVTVTVNQNGVFTPSGPVTDARGVYTGTLGIGADKRDRDITLSVTVDGKTRQTAVHVTGTRISLQAVPSAPSPGQSVQLTATVTDSAGTAIPGVGLTLGGGIPVLSGRTLTTNSTGVASTSFVAPTVAGAYAINATGNGINSPDYQLQVFSSAVPAAVIPAGSAPSLAASPNVLSVNTVGSSTNRTTLRFLFLDGQNQPIQNVRVRFLDATLGLPGVGASISSGTSTLYTDAAGTVTAEYISGQNSSPTNGVTVRACYSPSDFTSTSDCPASVTASLTVAGQALSLSLGDDNLMSKGSGSITYIKRFAVTVADSAGRAVADAPVDISVDLTHYGKGIFTYGYTLSDVPISPTAAFPTDTSTTPQSILRRVWCPNEDTNRNGNVDPGENLNGSLDSNSQPTLEPRKSDLLISYDSPTVTRTDANGVLLIKVEYSQSYATWLAYKVRVTANVAGSQGMAERLFVTDALQDDIDNGSFRNPPYGVGACTSPN